MFAKLTCLCNFVFEVLMLWKSFAPENHKFYLFMFRNIEAKDEVLTKGFFLAIYIYAHTERASTFDICPIHKKRN